MSPTPAVFMYAAAELCVHDPTELLAVRQVELSGMTAMTLRTVRTAHSHIPVNPSAVQQRSVAVRDPSRQKDPRVHH